MPIHAIPASTLKHWLNSGDVALIDVREPAEFSSAHIPGAQLKPLATLPAALTVEPGKKLVMQCKAGRRGETACGKLLAANPDLEIYNLEGGIDAWIAAGFPVERSGKKILPLDRQVQLTIGAVLLGSSAAGYGYAMPNAFAVTGLVGLGLSIAGLTGFCGLARLLAAMPWNQRA